jgi:hypothetical protein
MKNLLRIIVIIALIFACINPTLAQWVLTNGLDGGIVHALAINGNNLFAGTEKDYAGTISGRVFLSTDNGINWHMVQTGLINTLYVYPNGEGGTNLLAGTGYQGISLSTDNGTSWTWKNAGLPLVDAGPNYWLQQNVLSFAISPNGTGGTNIFAGTFGAGIFLSTNNGTSWTSIGIGLFYPTNAFAISGTNLFAGTFGGGVYLSTNDGTNWSAVNSGLNSQIIVKALALSGTNLYAAVIGTNLHAGIGSGIFLSTNNGTNWSAASTGLTDTNVNTLAVNGINLYAGTNSGGVFLSTNNGTSWAAAGLTSTAVNAFALNDTFLFAGTNTGVWRRPLSQMITSVNQVSIHLPDGFELNQNYPNPFNPTTTITFSIPLKSFITLNVFDLLGREVATIVSEEMSAGNYTRQWNAGNMSSGIYFYRLQAGLFTETKKLFLIR